MRGSGVRILFAAPVFTWENGGGQPRIIALLSSYLFAEPTHLNDLWERKSGQTTQYWTLPYVSGKRLPSAPVYVLTSHFTFSGAEEFGNNLKALKACHSGG
jgi:hypothetical protein